MTLADAFDREARRLAAIADDMVERLAALRSRAEAAAEHGIPGPTATDLTRARRLAESARAAAKAAARVARRGAA